MTLQQLHRLGGVVGIPDGDKVVIASAGKVPSICCPLQPTDLQLVQHRTIYAMLWLPNIMMVDLTTVSTTWKREDILIQLHWLASGHAYETAATLKSYQSPMLTQEMDK